MKSEPTMKDLLILFAKFTLVLAGLTVLASCASLTKTRGIDADDYVSKETLCKEIFSTITFSRQNDTLETIRQVKLHNEIYRAMCHGK